MFKPNFQIDNQILNDISHIAEIKSIVDRSNVLPLHEAKLQRQAAVRMAHTSTSIEGNKLAEFQVDKVLSGINVTADSKSIQEVKNYQKALKEIDNLASQAGSLTIEQILHLHKILMEGLLEDTKIGAFRPSSVYIVDDLGDGRERIWFEAPEAAKVPFLVNELLLWLIQSSKEDLHPILKAAIFHIQFVTIHPFTDGNGRITRLLTAYLLKRDNWDLRKILVLEDYYNEDRHAYYAALNLVQGDKYQPGRELTTWMEYFIGGFLYEASKVLDEIQSIGFSATDQKEPIYLDKDGVKLMDFLSTMGRMTSKDVMEILPIAKRTAQLKLKSLIGKGLIKAEGAGPSTYYTLNQ